MIIGGKEFSDQQVLDIAALDFGAFLRIEGESNGYTVPRFHFEIANFLQGKRGPESINTKKVVRGFRLAAKSYLFRAFCRFRQLRIPQTQVIIQSSSGPNANKFVRAYYKELKESILTKHLAPKEDSSELQFNLMGMKPESGFSVEAAGLGTSLTGSRCDLYFLDDPEPDDEPEGWYMRVIRVMMEARNILHAPDRHNKKLGLTGVSPIEATQLIVACQPHWSGSAYIRPGENDMIELGEDDAHPLSDAAILDVPVINSQGDWTWRAMMEAKYFNHREQRPMTVDEVRNGMTREVWELQYMINPSWLATAGATLNLGCVPRVRHPKAGSIMFVDPADSEDGCETSWMIFQVVEDMIHIQFIGGCHGETYEGDVEDETIGESIWAKIFEIADEFKVERVCVEKNLKSAAAACRRFLDKTHREIATDFYQIRGEKTRRINRSLEQPINNGMVSADPTVFKDPKTLRQFTKLRWRALPKPCDRVDITAAGIDWAIENRGIISTKAESYDPAAFREAVASSTRRGICARGPVSRIGR